MEITDFFTKAFLASFTGTLVCVELIVFSTKDFPLIKKIPTKIYTLILAIVHLLIVKFCGTATIELNVEYFYRLFINALLVQLILCGGYDTVMDKLKPIEKLIDGEGEIANSINEIKNIENDKMKDDKDINKK